MTTILLQTMMLVLMMLMPRTTMALNLPPSFSSDINRTTCTVSSSVPIVTITSAAMLAPSVLYPLRAAYPATTMVAFALPSSLYDLGSSNLVLNVSMSCSYFFGGGSANASSPLVAATQIMHTPNVSSTPTPTILITNAHDIVVVDVAVDWDDQLYTLFNQCQYAANYNTTSPILSTPLCAVQVPNLLACCNYLLNPAPLGALQSARIAFTRISTRGGVSLYDNAFGGVFNYNNTVSSSFITSVGNGINGGNLNPNLIIFNNTIYNITWGSGVFLYSQQYGLVHHNRVGPCGQSCFYFRRSFMQTVEFNDCRGFSLLPNAGGGSAGYYSWNAVGWHAYGRIVRNNYFWQPGQQCFYFDAMDSNYIFEFNICVTSSNRLNGGKQNKITNNLFIWTAGGSMGSINCPQMAGTPDTWLTCYNVISQRNTAGDVAFLWQTLWPNYYVQGESILLNASIPAPQAQSYFNIVPEYQEPIWCNSTAGPTSVDTRTDPRAQTYTLNGHNYGPTSDGLASNNHIGHAFVYTTAAMPGFWSPGWGCICPGGGCTTTYNQTQWPNLAHNVATVLLDLQFFNVTNYNGYTTPSSQLFGVDVDYNNIEPKMMTITDSSDIGVGNPELLVLPFQYIGLAIFCQQPLPPTNGAVNCSSDGSPVILARSVCDFTCSPGYSLVGTSSSFSSSSAVCLANAQWNIPLPTLCVPDVCSPAPTASPTNGTTSCTLSVGAGSVCTSSCAFGYDLTPSTSASFTCSSATSSWISTVSGSGSGSVVVTAAPTCAIIEGYCPLLPAIANGITTCSHNATNVVGTLCSFSCALGYSLTPATSATTTCMTATATTGTWSLPTLPTCQPTAGYCTSPFSAAYSTSTCNGITINSICNVTCNIGLFVSGTSNPMLSTVQEVCSPSSVAKGVWSNVTYSPHCITNPTYCPAISFPNGGIVQTSGQMLNAYATLSCNNGFVLAGETKTYCMANTLLNGYWNNTLPSCLPLANYCGAPSIPSLASATCTGYAIGSTCLFSCAAGYTVNATFPYTNAQTATCTSYNPSYGTWTNRPSSCTLIPTYCPLPSLPAGLSLSCLTAQPLGAACTVSCNTTGFVVVGQATIFCTVGGGWSPSLPTTCVNASSSCPPITTSSANVVVSYSAAPATPGTTALLSCSAGHIPTGTVVAAASCLLATPAPKWNVTATMTCTALNTSFCPPPPPLSLPQMTTPTGNITCTLSFSVSSSCSWSCAKGYTPTGGGGATTTTCSAAGSWTGAGLATSCTAMTNYCIPQATPGGGGGGGGATITCTSGNMLGSQCTATCGAGKVFDATRMTTAGPVVCGVGSSFQGDWSGWLASQSCIDPSSPAPSPSPSPSSPSPSPMSKPSSHSPSHSQRHKGGHGGSSSSSSSSSSKIGAVVGGVVGGVAAVAALLFGMMMWRRRKEGGKDVALEKM